MPTQVTLGFPGEIAGKIGDVITFDTTGDYLYEFISSDNGANYFAIDLTRAPDQVQGNLTVTGNLITNGGRIENGYQYSAAVTGFQVTVLPTVSRVIFDPATTLANGNVTLPTGNVDARTINISSTTTITAFAVNGAAGTVVKPSGNITLTAGTQVCYFFHANESTWYKIA